MSKDQEDRNIHEDGEKVNERAAMRSLDPQIYPFGRGGKCRRVEGSSKLPKAEYRNNGYIISIPPLLPRLLSSSVTRKGHLRPHSIPRPRPSGVGVVSSSEQITRPKQDPFSAAVGHQAPWSPRRATPECVIIDFPGEKCRHEGEN